MLAWLAELPAIKQQPNLVFAAARWHGVPAPGPYAGLREALLGDDGSIRDTILTRSTQTNEVGRLATLAPAFALLGEEPLALLEVGAERRPVPVPRPVLVRLAHRRRRHAPARRRVRCWSAGPRVTSCARTTCPR